jgi:hypothetical protein
MRSQRMETDRLVSEMVDVELEELWDEGRGCRAEDPITDTPGAGDGESFLTRVRWAAHRQGVDLSQFRSKTYIDQCSERAWVQTLNRVANSSDRLKYWGEELSLADSPTNIRNAENWWHKAVWGVLLPPAEGVKQPDCGLCSQELSLRHIILDCPKVNRNQSDTQWIESVDAIRLTMLGLEMEEWENPLDPFSYWLHPDRTNPDRAKLGGILRRTWNRWNQDLPIKRNYTKYIKVADRQGLIAPDAHNDPTDGLSQTQQR